VAKLAAGGRICAGWPKAYGGQDLSVLENVVLVEEFARAAAPAEARKNGAAADPVIRQRLALAWSKIRIMEVNGRRNLSGIFDPNLSAAQQQGLAALAATNKMFWSEYHRDMELAMDILGMAGQVLTGGCADDYPVSPLQSSFFFSRSEAIWAERPRCSATSWESACWACPKRRGRWANDPE